MDFGYHWHLSAWLDTRVITCVCERIKFPMKRLLICSLAEMFYSGQSPVLDLQTWNKKKQMHLSFCNLYAIFMCDNPHQQLSRIYIVLKMYGVKWDHGVQEIQSKHSNLMWYEKNNSCRPPLWYISIFFLWCLCNKGFNFKWQYHLSCSTWLLLNGGRHE